MEKITFELEAVTPMFISGADQNDPPEFRPPSIKGLLRFWYRAIYPNSYKTNENRLFGSTENRSPFRIRYEPIKNGELIKEKGDDQYSFLSYLGRGILGTKGAERDFFNVAKKSSAKFGLTFLIDRMMSLEDKKCLFKSFWALSMFGGIGSRSRRGFGSFKITKVDEQGLLSQLPPPSLNFNIKNITEYKTALEDFTKEIKMDSSCPDYTSFSNNTIMILTKEKTGNKDIAAGVWALKEIGEEFLSFRSYKTNFHYDHDLVLNFLKGVTPTNAPIRSAFGLPHNYFFSDSWVNFEISDYTLKKLKEKIRPGEIPEAELAELEKIKGFKMNNSIDEIIYGLNNKTGRDYKPYRKSIKKIARGIEANVDFYDNKERKPLRRASPLIFHVQGFDNGTACVLVTFLPAIFLPENEKIRLLNKDNKNVVEAIPPDFRAVHFFIMDHLLAKGGREII